MASKAVVKSPEAENKPKIKRELHPKMKEVQWQPGESGNPGGRPKKKPITEMYEELLGDPDFLVEMRKSICAMVKSGRMVGQLQLKEMTDRVEGKVTLPIEADISVNLADAIAEARKRAGR